MGTHMKRPDIGFNRSVSLPLAWRTAPVQLMAPIASKETADGHTLLFSSGTLADGTNLWVLLYPGGARLARLLPGADTTIEEATRGNPPWDRHRPEVDEAWGLAREMIAKAQADVAKFDELPRAEKLERYRASNLKALTEVALNVADTLVAYRDDRNLDRASVLDRLQRALTDAAGVGATRAQIAEAVAAAKPNRGPDHCALLDALIAEIINADDPSAPPSDMGER